MFVAFLEELFECGGCHLVQSGEVEGNMEGEEEREAKRRCESLGPLRWLRVIGETDLLALLKQRS